MINILRIIFHLSSDTKHGINGTLRTTPGPSRSKNHVLVYSSKDRTRLRGGKIFVFTF